MNYLDSYKNQISELCDNHKVQKLYVFGSVLTDQFNENSDIDLLIQFQPFDVLDYFENYMDLKEKLENILQRPVDLLENQAIKNPIFRQILEREKKLFYERKNS